MTEAKLYRKRRQPQGRNVKNENSPMEREQKRVATFLVVGVFFLLIEQLHVWGITYNLDEKV